LDGAKGEERRKKIQGKKIDKRKLWTKQWYQWKR